MTARSYRYTFPPGPGADDLQDTLLLSILACEALHGDARVRLEVDYKFDRRHRHYEIAADSDVGRDLNRLFTGLLAKEFGPDSFRVEPLEAQPTDRPRSNRRPCSRPHAAAA